MKSFTEEQSKFVGYEPCEKCGSKDNVGVWEKTINGKTTTQKYCFSCAEVRQGETTSQRSSAKAPSRAITYPPARSGFHQLSNRRITKDTCGKYQVASNGPIVYFPSVWEGKVLGYKVRDFLFSKSFKKAHMFIEGDYTHFFGWQATHTKNIVAIAYGELDAMAVYEATGIPCLSPPAGDGSLANTIKKDWARLSQFEKIVILPDQDKSGLAATAKAVELLGESRVYVSRLSQKDPNDYLIAGKASLLKQDFYAAQPSAAGLFVDKPSSLIDNTMSVGMLSGIQPLDRCLRGFRSQEATYVLGAPSHGKTTFVINLLASFIKQGIRVGALVLEGTHKKFVTRLANVIYGGNLVNADPDEVAAIKNLIDEFFALSNLTGRDSSPEALSRTITGAVKALDVKLVVVDNLTGASDPNKFFESSSNLVMTLDSLVTSLDVHIMVVSHVGRGDYAEPPKLGSGLGSGHIERFAYNVLGIHRNKDITRIEVLKNREYGDTKVFYGELNQNTLNYRFFEKSSHGQGQGHESSRTIYSI